MDKSIRLSRALFAAVFIGLGVVGLISGDFASVWQRIPIKDLPYRNFFAYLTAVIELLGGLGLLFRPTLRYAACLLFAFTWLWVILLRLPAVIAVPSLEATWLGFGEIGTIVASAWVLFASHSGLNWGWLTGDKGIGHAGRHHCLRLGHPAAGQAHGPGPVDRLHHLFHHRGRRLRGGGQLQEQRLVGIRKTKCIRLARLTSLKRREPKQNEAREASRRECTLMCMTDCESEAQRSYARRSSFKTGRPSQD